MKNIVSFLFVFFCFQCFAQSEVSSPDYFSCGLRRVVDETTMKVGFEDKKGKMVLPAQYCKADRFVKKKCAVYMNAEWTDFSATDGALEHRWIGGKWGVIDKTGKYVKPCIYERSWNAEMNCFQYVAPTDSFYFTSKGKIVPIKK
ncbi:MAG: WG repeat-containing protein [Paludibacteraceae bacterium]|nr:WG repeat-containing protein [Paludibacteraceae bacterium]